MEIARNLSTEDVSEFLRKNRLEMHVENFATEEVDGELLSRVVSEKNSEFLKCLGVTSPLHIQKVFIKFPTFCVDKYK